MQFSVLVYITFFTTNPHSIGIDHLVDAYCQNHDMYPPLTQVPCALQHTCQSNLQSPIHVLEHITKSFQTSQVTPDLSNHPQVAASANKAMIMNNIIFGMCHNCDIPPHQARHLVMSTCSPDSPPKQPQTQPNPNPDQPDSSPCIPECPATSAMLSRDSVSLPMTLKRDSEMKSDGSLVTP